MCRGKVPAPYHSLWESWRVSSEVADSVVPFPSVQEYPDQDFNVTVSIILKISFLHTRATPLFLALKIADSQVHSKEQGLVLFWNEELLQDQYIKLESLAFSSSTCLVLRIYVPPSQNLDKYFKGNLEVFLTRCRVSLSAACLAGCIDTGTGEWSFSLESFSKREKINGTF